MKEALFIFLVLIALAVFTAYRYRKQISAMLNFWRTLQAIREKGRSAGSNRIQDAPAAAGPLVNCPKCGTWVSEEKAIKLGRSAYYCSTKCLEASVKTV
ncbi:MAG: hypothetical protein ABIU09_01690 [Pyrinomonadaceae bacterium]